jgi:multiple antibiotic resistance protein
MASDLFLYISVTFGALLPIVNPLSTAPVFLAVTKTFSTSDRHRQALLAAVYMTVILLVSLFAGALVLEFFGITLPILRGAGGLIIARVGFSMLDASTDAPVSESMTPDNTDASDVALTPIAMPMLAGPGSIALTIAMATESTGPVAYLGEAIGITLVALVSWIVLYFSSAIIGRMGKAGVNALTRIMGLMLVCIGIQFIVTGFIEGMATDRMINLLADVLEALDAR